jgi:hypothetical protein
MYKKFLVSTLLTLALAGCGQQSSNEQTGDQTEAASPVQDQITTPAPTNEPEQNQQSGPSSAEPTQAPPIPAPPPETNPPIANPGDSSATPTSPNATPTNPNSP